MALKKKSIYYLSLSLGLNFKSSLVGWFGPEVFQEIAITCWPGLQSSEGLARSAGSASKVPHWLGWPAGYRWSALVPPQEASPEFMVIGFLKSRWFKKSEQKLQYLLWPVVRGHSITSAVFYWITESILFQVRGDQTRAWTGGGQDPWLPSGILTPIAAKT